MYINTLNYPSFSLSEDTASAVRMKSHAALSPSNHHQGQPPPGSVDSMWRWQRLCFLSLQVLYFWTEWIVGDTGKEDGSLWLSSTVPRELFLLLWQGVNSRCKPSEMMMPCPEYNVLNIKRTE